MQRSWSGLFDWVEKEFDRISERHKSLSYQYNEEFMFDWNNYKTIKPSEMILKKIEDFLDTDDSARWDEGKYDFAWLNYKVATYYNHIQPNPTESPDIALARLQVAAGIFETVPASILNHIAFSYQQKFAQGKKAKTKDYQSYALDALQYCNKVIDRYIASTKPDELKDLGFAFFVEALTLYEMGELKNAIAIYRQGLDIYEKHNLFSDHYARGKNRWAMMLTEDKQLKEAENAFLQLEAYWNKNQDMNNPYPGRFYTTYGNFLMESAPKLALEKYTKAYEIYTTVYGKDHKFTQEALTKIKDLEKKLGIKNSSNYSPKLNFNNQPTTQLTESEKKSSYRPSS